MCIAWTDVQITCIDLWFILGLTEIDAMYIFILKVYILHPQSLYCQVLWNRQRQSHWFNDFRISSSVIVCYHTCVYRTTYTSSNVSSV